MCAGGYMRLFSVLPESRKGLCGMLDSTSYPRTLAESEPKSSWRQTDQDANSGLVLEKDPQVAQTVGIPSLTSANLCCTLWPTCSHNPILVLGAWLPPSPHTARSILASPLRSSPSSLNFQRSKLLTGSLCRGLFSMTPQLPLYLSQMLAASVPHKYINPLSHLTTSSLSSDPVPKPFIKIEKREEVNNSCHLKLLCEISDDRSVNYTWYGDLEAFPTAFHSNVLEITINPQKYSGSYTCQISNAVSSKNDTIYFTLPCTLCKKYSQGSWGWVWVTSFVLDEERCGNPIQHPACVENPKGICETQERGSTPGSATTSPGFCGACCPCLQREADTPSLL